MSSDQNLFEVVQKWRRGVESARAEAGDVRSKNPYGRKIYDLNQAWGEVKREHDAKIAAAHEEYKSTLADLLAKSAEWKNEYAEAEAPVGRPKNPDYSDEVKIAAAEALRRGEKKTTIRVVLGVNHTPTLNRVLTEGEALLKAREGADW